MKTLDRFMGARIWRALGVGCAVVLLSGCSSLGGNHPPVPAKAESIASRYLIGPLDALNVVVWRNPELSTIVTVRPDGMISTPLVEDLKAAGKSPSELAREMERSLSRVIRDPVVSVVVTSFQGIYSEQIRIVGEASRPQSVPYRKDMTLLDVMIQVGGLTDFADGNAAVLIRGAEGGRQYSVRLKDLLRRGDISANAPVVPGDIIIVPQGWF